MRRIDALHLDYPFAGSRMPRDMLRGEGVVIGREPVRTMTRRMCIEALYRRPNTSKPAPGHKIYPSPRSAGIWLSMTRYVPIRNAVLTKPTTPVSPREEAPTNKGNFAMHLGLTRRGFGRASFGALAAPVILRGARADAPLRLRCSLDTAPSHPRNQGVADYLKKVEAASGGQITTELFNSGQLFADLNVSKALMQGQVEMAVPGAWVLTGIVPDCDMVQLPYLYGQSSEVVHKVTGGKPGQFVGQQLQTKLQTHLLGPWMDQGYTNWYSTKTPLISLESFKGLKIRSPGGAAISWRIKFLGGIANTTAWPNVPLALSQGTFDALVTTDESLKSAKLWEAGVRWSYADHQFMGQYIPMIANGFWTKLSAEQQKMMTDIWAENIATYSADSFTSQASARKTLEANGVKFTDPSAAVLFDTRKRMVAEQDGMIREANLSPEIVRLVREAIAARA